MLKAIKGIFESLAGVFGAGRVTAQNLQTFDRVPEMDMDIYERDVFLHNLRYLEAQGPGTRERQAVVDSITFCISNYFEDETGYNPALVDMARDPEISVIIERFARQSDNFQDFFSGIRHGYSSSLARQALAVKNDNSVDAAIRFVIDQWSRNSLPRLPKQLATGLQKETMNFLASLKSGQMSTFPQPASRPEAAEALKPAQSGQGTVRHNIVTDRLAAVKEQPEEGNKFVDLLRKLSTAEAEQNAGERRELFALLRERLADGLDSATGYNPALAVLLQEARNKTYSDDFWKVVLQCYEQSLEHIEARITSKVLSDAHSTGNISEAQKIILRQWTRNGLINLPAGKKDRFKEVTKDRLLALDKSFKRAQEQEKRPDPETKSRVRLLENFSALFKRDPYSAIDKLSGSLEIYKTNRAKNGRDKAERERSSLHKRIINACLWGMGKNLAEEHADKSPVAFASYYRGLATLVGAASSRLLYMLENVTIQSHKDTPFTREQRIAIAADINKSRGRKTSFKISGQDLPACRQAFQGYRQEPTRERLNGFAAVLAETRFDLPEIEASMRLRDIFAMYENDPEAPKAAFNFKGSVLSASDEQAVWRHVARATAPQPATAPQIDELEAAA